VEAQSETDESKRFHFATRSGNPENSKNILRRHVYPACDDLEIRRANWLTFRRTFSTWSHKNGIPRKDIAELMGHADVTCSSSIRLRWMRTNMLARRSLEKIWSDFAFGV
jgi:integrase